MQSPVLGSPSPRATGGFSPKHHTMAQAQSRRCPPRSSQSRAGSSKKEQVALEGTVPASWAVAATTPALAAPDSPHHTMRGAVSTQGLPSKTTSSTPVLRDGSARCWGRASKQSVLVAGLARGHQSQHRSAARDVLGSETHQGRERHRKEGGGRAKHPRESMGRVFQHQSHGVAQPRQSHAGRAPGWGHGTGTSHHHHATSSHIQALLPRRAGKSGGETEAWVWRPGSSRGAMPNTRTAQAATDTTRCGRKVLSPCETRSGSKGSWQHGDGSRDGDRVGTA